MACYLLKYDAPAGDPSRPGAFAQYYCGFSADCPTHRNLVRRILSHANGDWIEWSLWPVRKPPALPRWFFNRGIRFRCARIWLGAGRDFERKIKRCGHYKYRDLAFRMRAGLPILDVSPEELELIGEINRRLAVCEPGRAVFGFVLAA